MIKCDLLPFSVGQFYPFDTSGIVACAASTRAHNYSNENYS
jgi:hypothetical protein